MRLFVAVYEEGSFSKAAARENATQPGLSTQVAQLEQRLGVSLFERRARGVAPTVAGRRFYRHALAVLRAVNAASQDMRELAGAVSGALAVGLPSTTAKAALGPVLARYEREHPLVEIRVAEAYSATLAGMLSAGELDFAVLAHASGEPHLQLEELYTDRFVLVTGPASGLRGLVPLRMADLPPFKLVLPSTQHSARDLFRDHIRTGRLPAARIIEIDGTAGTLELVRNTGWAALLPVAAVMEEVQAGTLTVNPLESPDVPLAYFVAHPVQRPLTAAARAFVGLLRAELDRVGRVWAGLAHRQGD